MDNQNISISTLPIRLGQFLKFANVVQDGLEAKILIFNNTVRVNGQVESRRGRKLFEGDRVQIGKDLLLTVISSD